MTSPRSPDASAWQLTPAGDVVARHAPTHTENHRARPFLAPGADHGNASPIPRWRRTRSRARACHLRARFSPAAFARDHAAPRAARRAVPSLRGTRAVHDHARLVA